MTNNNKKTESLSISLEDDSIRNSYKQRTPVYANIYDFSTCFNCCCSPCGLGVYHTGIEIYNSEYMYFGFKGDESGIGYIEPRTAAYQFKEQILLGYTEYTHYEVQDHVLEPLHLAFTGNRYDLLQFNCNHFARRFANMLQVSRPIPQEVYRITNCLNNFRCLIPDCILNGRLDWFNFGEGDSYEEIKDSMHASFSHK